MSHVDFKKWSCRHIDFKKSSCRHINFKKWPMSHVTIYFSLLSHVTKPQNGACRLVEFRGLGPSHHIVCAHNSLYPAPRFPLLHSMASLLPVYRV